MRFLLNKLSSNNFLEIYMLYHAFHYYYVNLWRNLGSPVWLGILKKSQVSTSTDSVSIGISGRDVIWLNVRTIEAGAG